MNATLEELFEVVVNGQGDIVQQKVNEALISGVNPAVILNEAMIPAMSEVGRRFEEGEFFVPEMLVAARAMQHGMELLTPYLQKEKVESKGKVAIGTIKGDLHDIGKNLVGMMLEGAGFEIQDLGNDVSPEKFVEAARSGANIIAISALLSTTMITMKNVIEALAKADLPNKTFVIVGGAPLTEEYAKSIGADGYAPDASQAVNIAKTLLATNRVNINNET
jgi:5-methyltetrahydrofolate--homocysteine methyltransferase